MKDKSPQSQPSDISSDASQDNRLEAVRDLLFGQNDLEYRKEFKEIRDSVQAVNDKLEASIDANKSDYLLRIENLEKKVTEQIATTEAKLSSQIAALQQDKLDRKKLADILQHIVKELNS